MEIGHFGGGDVTSLEHRAGAITDYAARPSERFLVPFEPSHDPVRQFLVADIADDPDFTEIELQTYDDEVTGRGMVVTLHRSDGKVDWHVTPGLLLDPSMACVGSGVGRWEIHDFRHHLEITPTVLDARVDLPLTDGRVLRFEAHEERVAERRGIDMLAPVGAHMEEPAFLPLYALYGLDFAYQRGTSVRLTLGRHRRQIKPFPLVMPYAGRRCLMLRYCADPLNIRVNPARRNPPHSVLPDRFVKAEGVRHEFDDHRGYAELRRIAIPARYHEAWMAFDPALPDLGALDDGVRVHGGATLGIDTEPFIFGRYEVYRSGNGVSMGFQPSIRWRPRGSTLARLTIGLFPPSFRRWPLTYRWDADIDLDAAPLMRSAWHRTDR
jgi:hypothetical protein